MSAFDVTLKRPCEKYLGRGEPDLSNRSTNSKTSGYDKGNKRSCHDYTFTEIVDMLCTISPPSSTNTRRQL